MNSGKKILFSLLAAPVLLAACATGPSGNYRRALDAQIASSSFDAAVVSVEAAKDKEYGRKNAVLYYLDRGMLLQDASRYVDSDASFDQAEQRMEELYTKSISKSAGMFLLNDATVDYAGEPFERALMNVFRALNFVYSSNTESALVECRKVTEYLMRYRDFMQGKSGYKDDAWAQYLSGMLFEEGGKQSDARISYQDAARAYGWYASDFATPAPDFSVPAYSQLGGNGELVVLHYNGKAPRKTSKTIQVAWSQALAFASAETDDSDDEESKKFRDAVRAGITGNAITVAFPAMVQDPYTVAASEVQVAGRAAPTQLVENISAIAKSALDARMTAISARAIARATIKYVLVQTASNQAEQQGGSLMGMLTKAVGSAIAAGTEAADTRSWLTVPAQIRVARMVLPPGAHNVQLQLKDASGLPLGTLPMSAVNIQAGKRTYIHFRTSY